MSYANTMAAVIEDIVIVYWVVQNRFLRDGIIM
jgi:hypothetical protein